MTLDERWQQIRHFFSKGVWEVDPRQLGRGRFFLLHQAQLATLVVRDFIADRCMLRASALTYTSLLSIVPLLALMFSVLKGFGVQNTLEPLILERIAVGSEEIVDNIITYINNTNVGSLGTVGLVVLVVTVLALLSNIEESFNHIWGVKETRSLMRRFADYFSVVTFGPIFVLAAISMTATLQTQGFLQHLMTPRLRRPADLSAVQGSPLSGDVGGLHLPLRLHAQHQGRDPFGRDRRHYRRDAVATRPVGLRSFPGRRGPLQRHLRHAGGAADPHGLDLLLLADRPARPGGHLRLTEPEDHPPGIPWRRRQFLQPRTGGADGADGPFRRLPPGGRPWTRERIGEELELPPRLVRSILSDMVRLGFVSVVQGETQEAFQPGRSPETLEVFAVVRALRDDGVDYLQVAEGPERDQARALVARLEEVQQQALGGMTIRELVRRSEKAEGQ